MDCRKSSELMMKYLDGEADYEQERLLFEHLESCGDCRMEFQSLKETFSMLEDMTMEDAPKDIEHNVISRIEEMEETKAKSRWLTLTAVILTAWMGLTCLVLYTPFLDMLIGCFNSFLDILGHIPVLLENVFCFVVTSVSKLIVLVRAFSMSLKAFVDMNGIIVLAMLVLMAVILRLYGYMLKGARR